MSVLDHYQLYFLRTQADAMVHRHIFRLMMVHLPLIYLRASVISQLAEPEVNVWGDLDLGKVGLVLRTALLTGGLTESKAEELVVEVLDEIKAEYAMCLALLKKG